MAQRLKCLPAMRDTWVQPLGQEDPLEKETATHSSILGGESHGQRSLAGYSPQGRGVAKSQARLSDLTFTFLYSTGRETKAQRGS